MKRETPRTLSALWILLGAGLLLSVAYEMVDLLASEFRDSSGIWASIILTLLAGVAAVVFGVKTSSLSPWVRWTGSILSVALGCYTLYILALTPGDAMVRPMLVAQVFVLLLSAVTLFYLLRGRSG
jgi:peptidoglycan/LPS O-acetylase OafA/YrhL